jgi:hypothetical protein
MRQISKDSRTGQFVLLSTGMILAFLSLSCKPAPHSYVEALTMLKGTDYWELNCSEYICAAKHHPDCVARNFWEKGCDGDTYVVQDVASFDAVDTSKLLPGDVAAFHGVHVAAYIGNGLWMDSDYRHGGVGIMKQNRRRGEMLVRSRIKPTQVRNETAGPPLGQCRGIWRSARPY